MKYIYSIILIIILASIAIGLQVFSTKKEPQQDIAIKIDDRIITRNEFARLYSAASAQGVSRDDFIKSLIRRELLILEAEAEGVDKEESFRRSIKNYYEQSLTKILMDRKYAALQIDVGDDEIDAYMERYPKRFLLTKFSLPKEMKASTDLDRRQGERISLPFADFSQDMQLMLLSLDEGEVSKPVREDSGYVVFHVEKIEEESPTASVPLDRDAIRALLKEAKTGKAIDDWLAGLAEKARIKVFIEKP